MRATNSERETERESEGSTADEEFYEVERCIAHLQGFSVSTGFPRGNQVDGLARAYKFLYAPANQDF